MIDEETISHLDLELLESAPLGEEPGKLGATLEAKGLYSTFKFVLRLSPSVHERLSKLPDGIVLNKDISFEDAEAFSTYLHETIHWWQHVGSTFGLMFSLTYPAEAHANFRHLKRLGEMIGHKKPIRAIAKKLSGGPPDTAGGTANIIVNNQYDFDAFRRVAYSPFTRNAVVREGMFESIGHAYVVTYGNVVSLLSSLSDPNYDVLPNPADWHEAMNKLREEKAEGHYADSPITMSPVGLREIMEGQARFAQIQYLHFASGKNLDWESFRAFGMLEGGIYREAFDVFLNLSELPWPGEIDHPTVGLFLLICDMAINPGAGFPFVPIWPRAFLDDVDPMVRFVSLSRAARSLCPEVLPMIKAYSRDEYKTVSNRLAEVLRIHSPLAIAQKVSSWPEANAGIADLMKQHESFAFPPVNLPVQVMLSHFVSFMSDKFRHPEFFCWPGAWMAGERVSEEIRSLFQRHEALFVDKADDDGIFPRRYEHRDEAVVHEMFQRFYAGTVSYDMTQQWITKSGPFVYGYDWLVQNATQADMKAFADSAFETIYGIAADDVEVVE